MRCAACGAGLGTNDLQCPYCGQQTPLGAHHAQQQHQQRLHVEMQQVHAEQWQAHQRQAAAQAALEKSSRQALFWSLGGLIFCCGFVPSIIGLVLALRARKLAHSHQLIAPATSLVALCLSGLGVALGALIVTIAVLDARERAERLESVTAQLSKDADPRALTQPKACLLAEQMLLKEDYNKHSVSDVKCDGRLDVSGERATLQALRFKSDSEHHVVNACLELGARWTVTHFVKEQSCTEKPASGVAPGSADSIRAAASGSNTNAALPSSTTP